MLAPHGARMESPDSPQPQPDGSGPIPDSAGRRSAFRDVPWRFGDILIGLAPVVALRVASLMVGWGWLSAPPVWLALTLAVAGTAWMLVYPLWVVCRRHVHLPSIPSVRRFLIEATWAVPALVVMWAALVLLMFAWRVLFGEASLPVNPFEESARTADRTRLLMVALVAVTLAPLAEEVFFRGMLYNALRRWFPALVAGLVQALAFGLLHPYGAGYVVATTFSGLALVAFYEWRQTLLAPVFVHALQNLSAVAIALWYTADTPLLGVYGEPSGDGFLVTVVVPGSAAEAAGLRSGDVITGVDGWAVMDIKDIATVVRSRRVGDRIVVEYLRSGKTRHTEAVLKRRE
jgi:membrane protease YdiL (CAAX protease family)